MAAPSTTGHFTTILYLCSLATVFLAGTVSAELNLPIAAINVWAINFGKIIKDVSESATALHDIQTDMVLQHPTLNPINGTNMVVQMKQEMEKMLQMKVDAIERLVEVAEEAYIEHDETNIDLEMIKDYPKSKKLNTSSFHLEENEHFNYIPVNLSMSTVHVPTNVYDESDEVLNGVSWSEQLDTTFAENYKRDPTLTWQYFGSASGFFRNFPGIKWPQKGVDLYDCRTRGWYIQAATSPKDIVILLDTSGSMTGQRMEIAKATVEKILDTLSDDDFFNIIKFSQYPEYVDDCFNQTLVQANADNKKRLKEHLHNVTTEDIAYFDRALIEAFKLLQRMNDTDTGTMCNRAIMLITDGAPETFHNVFEMYNWPEKNVRVFTYLIGREVGEKKQVEWMACANKGYYSHISTLADVQEKVQDYIHVLSRPMVMKRAHNRIWTSVYKDAAGLKLMTSVAQPVFDRKNETFEKGILLGVMGTDVPLKELIKLTPQYKLGVNGYAFAITNNGYILFHPDFRPTQGDDVKPNYNSVDLAEVELSLDSDPVELLRRKMVNRKTGNVTMKVKIHYDKMKRVAIRENNYFFTEIADTPFSLGIALPSGYGLSELLGKVSLDNITEKDLDDLKIFPGEIMLAPWNYCKMDTNETRQDAVEMLLKYLKYGKQKNPIYKERCDNDLIESLLFDVQATRGALSAWMKENRDGTMNDSTSKKNGIEIVFIGTKGGLTRYRKLVEELTDPDFIESNNRTIEDLYYKRAVETGDSKFTFSVPFGAGEQTDFNNTILTASSPIIISADGREAVAAVVGLQMKYSKFYEIFINTTRYCPGCNLTCESQELDCYLLDNNGFVVLSELHQEVGKFFGELDATLMKELIENGDEPTLGPKRGVYQKIDVFDYQAICEIWAQGGSGANSIFIDPLRKIVSGMSWLFQEVALFLVHFNVYTWWYGGYTTVSGYDELDLESIEDPEVLIGMILPKLSEFGNTVQVRDWKNFLVSAVDYHSRDIVLEWYEQIRKQYGPRLSGHVECTKKLPLYLVTATSPQSGTLTKCGWCTRSYSIHSVPFTNLMLLAVDAACYCIMDPPISVEPKEVEYTKTETSDPMCQLLRRDVHRRRPSECHAYHVKDKSEECGRCSLRMPSIVLIVTLLTVFSLVSH